jgi:hypothetical protein
MNPWTVLHRDARLEQVARSAASRRYHFPSPISARAGYGEELDENPDGFPDRLVFSTRKVAMRLQALARVAGFVEGVVCGGTESRERSLSWEASQVVDV